MTHNPPSPAKPHVLTRWMRGPYHLHIVVVVILAAAVLVGGILTGQRFPATDSAAPTLT